MADRSFPFVPRRSGQLVTGDFWAIPLSDGRYACGRVLGLIDRTEPRSTVRFIGGLHDWVSDVPPDADSIAGARILSVGTAHLAAISVGGGSIVGHRDLDLDGIERPADVRSAWADESARARAEHLFVKGDPPRAVELRGVSSPLTDDMLRPITALQAIVQFDRRLTDADFEQLGAWLADQPHVQLRAFSSPDRSIADLEFLRYFPRLRRFSAEHLYNSLTSLDGLRHLPDELDELVIGQTRTQLDLRAIGRFQSLTRLSVEGQRKGLGDVLQQLTELEELTLRSITLPDLSMLLPLRRLRALELKLGGTRDLGLLPAVGQLEYVELWMLKGLTEIDPIGALSSLKYLFLQTLSGVTELPDLAGCPSLRRVHLETMKGITSLEPLVSARSLEELTIVDLPHLPPEAFQCLMGHPALRAITAGIGGRPKRAAVDALLRLPPASAKVDWRSV